MDKSVDKVDKSPNRQLFTENEPVIGLFAKQPLPGQVKTRLTPPLSPEQACQLYLVALEETVYRLQQSGLKLVLCYAGSRDWFESRFPGLPLLEQRGAGLGERMQAATEELFAAGASPVLLLGSDSPDLPLSLLRQALTELQSCEVVTVPCQDGGYALIGLTQSQPRLFEGIPWSTARVMAATRESAQRQELSYSETASWDDLDDAASLRRLLARSPESRTARFVSEELGQLL